MRGRSPASEAPAFILIGGFGMAVAVVLLWERRDGSSSTADLLLLVVGAVGFFVTAYGVVIAAVRAALHELDVE